MKIEIDSQWCKGCALCEHALFAGAGATLCPLPKIQAPASAAECVNAAAPMCASR